MSNEMLVTASHVPGESVSGCEPPVHAGEEVGRVAVADHHPLGAAGGAGRIDDVGQGPRPPLLRQRLRALDRESLVRRRVERQDLDLGGRQPAAQALLRDDQRYPRVPQHEVEPLRRVGRIEREIGAAGLQDAQERHRQLRRALQEDADRHLGADAVPAQAAGEPVRAVVQLGIGEARAAADQRLRLRCPRRLELEQAVDRQGRRELLGGVIGLEQELVRLGRAEQRQIGEPALGALLRCGEQVAPVAQQAFHGRRVEQIAVVVERRRQPCGPLFHCQAEVESRGRAVEAHGRQIEAVQLAQRRVGVLQGELDLEHRAVGQVAVGQQLLHEAGEGDVLMIVRVQRGGPDTPHPFPEGWISREVDAQDQRVDEAADDPFQLGADAPGHRRADDQVGAPRVAEEQRVKAASRSHEERGTLPAARLDRARRPGPRPGGGSGCRHGRSGPPAAAGRGGAREPAGCPRAAPRQ